MSRGGGGKGRKVPVSDLTAFVPHIEAGARALMEIARKHRDKQAFTDAALRLEEVACLRDLAAWIELGCPGRPPRTPERNHQQHQQES